jgi:hypothetical protein
MQSNTEKKSLLKHWFTRISGLSVGMIIITLLNGNFHLKNIIWLAYDKIGITVIALLPLAIWGIFTAIKAGQHSDFTLSYIGTTAQRFGLLGTVIGIVAATIAIGDKLNTGAAAAVVGALPAVGQALLSTAVGFIIAITCDFFRYLNVRHNAELEEPIS